MPSPSHTRRRGTIPVLAAVSLATVLAGCRGRQPAEAAAETRPLGPATTVPASAAAPATLAAGTPAGGLRDWIAEVRQGLASVPAQATSQSGDAQRRALDLYLTRQEYIEMYWGEGGRLTRGRELAPAIEEAENRFHLLLAALEPRFATKSEVLRREIASLEQQYDRVLAAALSARVPLDPHRVFEAERAPSPASPTGTGSATKPGEGH